MTVEDPRPIVVLLIDDQAFVGAAVGRLLATERDIELHCCTDATSAMEQATHLKPSVILQDLVMPGVDGLTLVRLFRDDPATARTAVIVLSGNDDAQTRERALAEGATDYLVKLPAKDVLIACIRRCANEARPPDATESVGSAASIDPPAGDALDPTIMAMFRGDDTDGSSPFLMTLLDQFMREAESRVEALRNGAAQRDEGALKTAAHSLKGSSLVMGAKRLAAVCTQIEEEMAATPGAALTAAVMADLGRELGDVKVALAAERARGSHADGQPGAAAAVHPHRSPTGI
jgi:CheY-like chemotaxis protein